MATITTGQERHYYLAILGTENDFDVPKLVDITIKVALLKITVKLLLKIVTARDKKYA